MIIKEFGLVYGTFTDQIIQPVTWGKHIPIYLRNLVNCPLYLRQVKGSTVTITDQWLYS